MKHLFCFFILIVPTLAEDGWEVCGVENEYKIFDEVWIYGGFDDFQRLCGDEGGELAILKDPDVAQCVMNIKPSCKKNFKYISKMFLFISNSQKPIINFCLRSQQ